MAPAINTFFATEMSVVLSHRRLTYGESSKFIVNFLSHNTDY